MPPEYHELYKVMDSAMEGGLSYHEAFEMPVDELELYVYLMAARSYRMNDAIAKK